MLEWEKDDRWCFRWVINVLFDGQGLAIKPRNALEWVSNEQCQASDESHHVGVWHSDEHWNWCFHAHQAPILIWAGILHEFQHFHHGQSMFHFGIALIDYFGEYTLSVWPLFVLVGRSILG